MANHKILSFHNDSGAQEIQIGVKQFNCIGATPPFDHPHIYLTMGSSNSKTCPYCSVTYIYNPNLTETKTIPEKCLWKTN